MKKNKMNKISLADAALEMREAGLNVAPIKADGAPNLPTWDSSKMVNFDLLAERFASRYTTGVCIICGEGSGGFGGLDLDTKHDLTGTLFEDFCAMVKEYSADLFERLSIGRSKSGGYHFYFLCDEVGKSQDLALRPATNEELKANPAEKSRPIVELKENKGMLTVFPTPKYKMIQGDLSNLARISPEERATLIQIGKAFNTYEKPQEASRVLRKAFAGEADEDNPFDAFNQKEGILNVFDDMGWKMYQRGGQLHIRTNSKSGAPHGTYKDGVLYFFSAKAGLPTHKAMNGVQAFSILNNAAND